MSEVTFKKIFKIDYAKLRYAGTWIGAREDLSPKWYKLYSFIAHVVFMSLLNISLVMNLIVNSSSLKEMALTAHIIMPVLMGQIKGLLLLKNQKYVASLIHQCENQHFRARNANEKELVTKKFHRFNVMRRVILSMMVVTFSGLMSLPVFIKTEQGLPMDAWFPFSVRSFPGYQIAYVHQAISGAYLSAANVYTDVFMGASCNFVGLQSSLLSIRIRQIQGDRKQSRQSLLECIDHHRGIVRFYKTINTLFGIIYFWQLFCSATSICMALFLLSLTKPGDFDFFFFLMFIVTTNGVLLIPCWFATEMTTKSELIPIAVYDCTWEDGAVAFKKDLLFFLKNTQKPLMMYGANLIEISVVTFLAVLRASMSYYTVMNNLNSSKDELN